jgi:DNA-binding SARP family transcriptional activator/Tfp pilus assembly protein PilF
METDFRILGPVEVWAGATRIALFGPRQQRALAALLLDPDRTVPIDHIIEAVWDQDPPSTAQRQVQDIVTRLRRTLTAVGAPPDIITTMNRGYAIRAAGHRIDAQLFQQLVTAAQQLADTDPAKAADTLRTALALWRGPALAGLHTTCLRSAAAIWNERRLSAWEHCLRLELELGRHHEVISELVALAEQQTFAEGPIKLLATALVRSGRHADALEAYQRFRRRLVDELGVEPSKQMQALHQGILLGELDLTEPDPAREPTVAPALTPAMLPLDIPIFAGRRRELHQLEQILAMASDQPTAVVISAIWGMAGVGKTTLAVHWAHQVRHRFPDGQLYLNLHGFDPNTTTTDPVTAMRTFLDVLGVDPQRIPATLDAQAGLYRSLLTGRRMLILLDNVRDADEVRPLLPGSPGCLVVVTSRHRLTSLVAAEAAQPIDVDLLMISEARELLSRRLGADRVAAEPLAVDELIGRCARLPLALAVVCGRAATRQWSSLAELADTLRELPRGSLDALDAGDAVTEVRAVFSWSYRVLDTITARLFRLLGLHPGPEITTATAASLASLPAEQTDRLLAELVRAHLLIEPAPGRYSFHDLLRAYAIELTHTQDTDTERKLAVHRMLDHHLHAAHTAAALLEPNRERITIEPPVQGVATVTPRTFGQAQHCLTVEHRVLVHLVRLAADQGFSTHTWQLAWTLTTYFHRGGHWCDQADTLHIALEAARQHDDALGQAYSHLGLARAYFRMGRYETAYNGLREALDLFTTSDHQLGQARVYGALGFFHTSQRRYREALRHHQISLDLFRGRDQQQGIGQTLNGLGWNHAMLGDYPQALTYCLQALDIQQEINDLHGQASTSDSLGYVYHHLGRHQEAVECYEAALRLFRAVNERYLEAETLIHLGDHHRTRADPTATRLTWNEALEILDELKHPDGGQVRAKLQLLSAASATAGTVKRSV